MAPLLPVHTVEAAESILSAFHQNFRSVRSAVEGKRILFPNRLKNALLAQEAEYISIIDFLALYAGVEAHFVAL